MRILLCYASRGAPDEFHQNLLPTGLVTMNAVLRSAGHASSLANLSAFTPAQVQKLFRTERPGLIGISQFTHNRFASLDIASIAKRVNPDCAVVLGGPHASHRYREMLEGYPDVDLIVVGEGEQTFAEVAHAVSIHGRPGTETFEEIRGIAFRDGGKIVRTADRDLIRDLDSLPPPYLGAAHAVEVDLHRQLEFITTSRGCPAACTFCASPRSWGKSLRFHSPGYIVDEIRQLRDRLGLIYFSIRDDTFTADRKRILELCRRIIDEKLSIMWNCQSRVSAVDDEMLMMMKRAGCECVQFGIETGSDRLLGVLKKRTTRDQMIAAAAAVRRSGMNLSIYLISGIPGETARDLRDTEELVARLLPHDGQVSPLAYYPGTEFFDTGVRTGTVAAKIFETVHDDALYAMPSRERTAATRRLVACLERTANRAAYTSEDFSAQKKLLGYCHATNVMAGEFHESTGEYGRAEREYREVLRREPDNPWGWVKLGEFCGNAGRFDEAEEAFHRLVRVVPAHAPAYVALGELSAAKGRDAEARDRFRKALVLNPYDLAARQGLAALQRKR